MKFLDFSVVRYRLGLASNPLLLAYYNPSTRINLRTVKLHRTNLTRKLKVQSVAELTRLAEEAGVFRAAPLQP